MTKRRKTKRRSQRGGSWWNPLSWGQSEETYTSSQSWGDWFSNTGDEAKQKTLELLNNANNAVGTAISSVEQVTQNAANSVGNMMSKDISFTGSTEQVAPAPIYGGRRSSMKRSSMKGGKGLTYYASPVSGLNVANPTTWQFYANGTNQYSVKGGSKKCKTRRDRKH